MVFVSPSTLARALNSCPEDAFVEFTILELEGNGSSPA